MYLPTKGTLKKKQKTNKKKKQKKKKKNKKKKNGSQRIKLDDKSIYMIFFSSDTLNKIICCEYSFELHFLFQKGTHNICLYREIDKKYTVCNLKITVLCDYALVGVCAVIRSNTVFVLKPLLLTYIASFYLMFL